jgi:hypothetical protein
MEVVLLIETPFIDVGELKRKPAACEFKSKDGVFWPIVASNASCK